MSFTFCTSAHAKTKAGANANTTLTNDNTKLSAFSDEVEDILCNIARVDLITNYGSLTTNGKKVLQSVSSAMIAKRIINYDMMGYTSLAEAQTMLDILDNEEKIGIDQIKDDKVRAYLAAT